MSTTPLPAKVGITTHILDTARGVPAQGVPVALRYNTEDGWQELAVASTDADGRARLWDAAPSAGAYQIRFEVAHYFAHHGTPSFYPFVEIAFVVPATDASAHYHVPLLLNPFGYSTYRGS